ncbi:MAG: hypothetical protein QOJ59_2871, partial [Thermomicrobiales bacterium]|nr:hypothetical protein [Thermomicrobiales bacterium]
MTGDTMGIPATVQTRPATEQDAAAIAGIYNQGIAERRATFETEPRTADDINARLDDQLRCPALVAEESGAVLGW